jgi:phospholipase C
MLRTRVFVAPLVALAAAGLMLLLSVGSATAGAGGHAGWHGFGGDGARTPIKHLVVIFQENVSFDHYFGTYPYAANTDGQTFHADPGTPAVDGLLPATSPSLPFFLRHSTNLLTSNPNTTSGGQPALPQRLDSSATGLTVGGQGQLTCDQDHDYTDEQTAFEGGKLDRFVQTAEGYNSAGSTGPTGTPCDPAQVMDYYDGNTVTGIWNYAQHFAMSDNSFGTTFGPSAPGAINLVSGNTGTVDITHTANSPSTNGPNADIVSNGVCAAAFIRSAPPWEAPDNGVTRTTTSRTTTRSISTPRRPTPTT